MTATTIVEGARVATLILVLVLAAALGLVVGNALQSVRSTSVGVGAAAPNAAVERGAPSSADPYRQLIRQASAADGADGSSPRGLAPR